MNVKLVCVILFAIVGVTVAECPDGWVVFGGSCYLFPQQHADYLGANNHCNLLHGHLVNIGSQTENGFIKSFVNAEKDHLHWIGLNDIAVEGRWVWSDTGERTSFTDWGSGQPDRGIEQNCVILHPSNSYKWHDEYCNVAHNFICERPQNSNGEIIG